MEYATTTGGGVVIIPSSLIETTKQILSIEEAVKEYIPGLTLKRRGRKLWGCCPFHSEDTASFMADPDKNLWRCFGCGEYGDQIDLVAKALDLTLPEAIKMLARDLGIAAITDTQARREISIKIQSEREQKELFKQLEDAAINTLQRLRQLQTVCQQSLEAGQPQMLDNPQFIGTVLLVGNIEIVIDMLLGNDAAGQIWAIGQGREILDQWDC